MNLSSRHWYAGVAVCIALACLLVVYEKGQDEEHLEEAANGADLYGVNSLDGFDHQGDDGEEDCGQESIEQAETYTSLWLLCVCGEERKRNRNYQQEDDERCGDGHARTGFS